MAVKAATVVTLAFAAAVGVLSGCGDEDRSPVRRLACTDGRTLEWTDDDPPPMLSVRQCAWAGDPRTSIPPG